MRIFVALEPSESFRAALGELQARLKAAGVEGRYLAPANLHMTLAFIGEWPEDAAGALISPGKPFSVTLSGLGIFPKAKVLWAGVAPSLELNTLAEQVRERLDEMGIPYDRQSFNPHITVVRKPVLPEEGILRGIRIPEADMTVRETCLYRSVREEEGMRYLVIGRSGRGEGKV